MSLMSSGGTGPSLDEKHSSSLVLGKGDPTTIGSRESLLAHLAETRDLPPDQFPGSVETQKETITVSGGLEVTRSQSHGCFGTSTNWSVKIGDDNFQQIGPSIIKEGGGIVEPEIEKQVRAAISEAKQKEVPSGGGEIDVLLSTFGYAEEPQPNRTHDGGISERGSSW